MVKKIKLKGARNTRLVPAFLGCDGKHVKEGAFIRSGKLNKVPKRKLNNFLKDYNIKTILDFRTDVEVLEAGYLKYPNDIEYIHIPLINQSFFGITHEKKMSKVLFKESKRLKYEDIEPGYMTEMYKSIVFDPHSQEKFKEFFDVLLSHKEGAILYHCNGGKDRTGITTLFILTLLCVKEEDILADFEMSDYFNRHYNRSRIILMKLFLFPFRKFSRILTSMLHAKRIYLENMINAINEKFGSVRQYLYEVIGIDQEKQNKLIELYME